MKLSFNTLGCPSWDLATICARGREYGFDGVDFRGYLDTLDVTLLPEFTTGVKATKQRLDDAGLAVSGISSSIKICEQDRVYANLEEARRTITLARSLNAPNVRIFGGGEPQDPAPELVKVGQDTMERILALDGAQDLHWLFESHDRWAQAESCRLLLDAVPNPAFGALWDVTNAYFVGSTNLPESFTALCGRVGYVHVKDAVHDSSNAHVTEGGWRYVSPGEGQMPLVEAVDLLKASGYDGWLMYEHEKRWHPTLPEPEEAFPAFIRWAKRVLG